MAIKKSDIYRSLWDSCDQLRGGMDASLYKDYILTLLFVKYVSDRAGKPDALIDVPSGCSFHDLKKLRGTKDIGEGIDTAIAGIAEANDLRNVIDRAYFNDNEKFGRGPKMVTTLTALLNIFSREELNFSSNRADGDDILGDAYEYLMRNFATESGKSKGQFYTPAEVSRVVAAVAGINRATSPRQTVYDPTCGSGSLLLKAADAADVPLTIYGQEFDITTRGLAKMNMIMHGREDAEIAQGDVIAEPEFKASDTEIQTFDFVVANPPFSTKAWGSGLTTESRFGRFDLGMPPEKNGDFAFLLHILASMKATGSGAVILPHGVLFRGNKEAELREKILKRGYIKAIIGLPANLFYGTGIPASILVLDKSGACAERPVFMIDASRGFTKDGPKNRLRARDIHKITDAYTREMEIPGYSRLVTYPEISCNDFNLNIPRYIDGSDPEDLQDIEAHLKGGVPNRDIDLLAEFWDVMPGVRATLFGPNSRPGYSDPLVEPDEVRTTIRNHPEFGAFRDRVHGILDDWAGANASLLDGIRMGDKPKALIHAIAEDMLDRFAAAPLIDKYEAYQRLMSYWAETMQDDVFIIADAGWGAAKELREARKETDKTGKVKWLEEADLTVNKVRLVADVIPPRLIVARFFPGMQTELDEAQASAEELGREIEEMVEEHGVEGGLLADALTEAGKLTAASIKARQKSGEAEPEEATLLKQVAKLMAAETAAKKAVKEAEETLTEATLKKYPELTEAEIRALVVDDKWLTDIANLVENEVAEQTREFTKRIRAILRRYNKTVIDGSESVTQTAELVETNTIEVHHLSAPTLNQRKEELDWPEVSVLEMAQGNKLRFDDGDWIEKEHIAPAGVRLIQTGNIGVGCFVDKNKKYIFEESYLKLRCKDVLPGDILVCRLAEPAGRACVVPDLGEDKMITSVDVTIFRPDENLYDRNFLVFMLSQPKWFSRVSDASGGTTRKRIARSQLGRMMLKVPHVDEQRKISQKLKNFEEHAHALEEKLAKSAEVKEGMMQNLLTGRIRLV